MKDNEIYKSIIREKLLGIRNDFGQNKELQNLFDKFQGAFNSLIEKNRDHIGCTNRVKSVQQYEKDLYEFENLAYEFAILYSRSLNEYL